MILASAFLAIESSLTDRLTKALSLITKELYAKVDEALASGDVDRAMQEINTLSLATLAEDTADYVEYMTSIAMLFGASRVTQNPGTSVVGMGFEALTTKQMAGAFAQSIGQRAETYLKQTAAAKIMPPVPVQKANPYHDAEGNFTDKDHATWGHDPITAAKEAMGDFTLRGMPKTSLWVGNCNAYANALKKAMGGGEVVEIVQTSPRTEYHNALKCKGKYYDWKDQAGVDDPTKLQFWDHANKTAPAGGRKYNPEIVHKDDRVLQPFGSFMDNAGNAFMNMVSSLHTSRVSAYGFTAEAMVLGLTEYQINEQLDTRTCPVCREMHGKTFKVSDARRALNTVTRVTDPEDLKQLQPWPSQSAAGLENLRGMSADELVATNWHIPPFHPGCRGLLIRAGKAPDLSSVVSGTVQEQYVATAEDFKALRVSANEAQLKLWNQYVKMAPAELVARLGGKKPDEFLAGLLEAKKPKEYAGLTSLSIAKNVTIRMSTEGFGTKNAFDQGVKIIPERKALHLDAIDLHEDDQAAGAVKKYMREFYMLAKDMGLERMELTAGLDIGGYAWAKYGFKPDAASWEALKKDLTAKAVAADTVTGLSDLQRKLYAELMASPDPASIYLLSDTTFGKQLLLGTGWSGEIDLKDSIAVTRFLSYIGELK